MAANNNRFLTDVSSKKLFEIKNSARFYQQLGPRLIRNLSTRVLSLTELAERLVALAHHSHSIRQMEPVREIAALLTELNLPEQYRRIGNYYHALYLLSQGQVGTARDLFDRVAAQGPRGYRAKAIGCIAWSYQAEGDYVSALSLYVETATTALHSELYDPFALAVANRNISIMRSLAGDHKGAIDLLESSFPLVRVLAPHYPQEYYSYLNSLAVELGEVGRVDEAERICAVTAASPYVGAYPELIQTRDEIALKKPRRSSTVALSSQPSVGASNVFSISVDRNTSTNFPESPRQLPEQQARVLSFTNWKTQMSREPLVKPKPRVSVGQMTRKQKIIRIVDLVCNEISDEQLDSILQAVERIAPDEKVKD